MTGGSRLMLYFLGQFGDQIPVLNVFRYITFRTGGATMTAIVFVFLLRPAIIAALRSAARARASRSATDGPQTHSSPRRARRPWAA